MSTINVGYIEGPSTASNKIYIKSGSVLDITNSPDGAAAIDLAVDAADITSGTLSDGRFASDSILFAKTAELAAGTDTSTTTSFLTTGASITIAAADANRCSKLIIMATGANRINKNSYALADFRISRTAPSTVDYQLNMLGAVGGATEAFQSINLTNLDSSLSNADHTYEVQFRKGSGNTIYAASIYYKLHGWSITVLGIK